MNYLELSIGELEKESKRLAKRINKDYKPDIIVFIAKGSYIIGKTLSDFFNVPLIEINAVRKGNKLKKILGPFLKLIPSNIKKYLRKKEIESGIHTNTTHRNVFLAHGELQLKAASNVLIVDDSIDTGYTAKQVMEYIKENFKNERVKFASLNYFEESQKVFKGDFNLYKNTIMIGPWSKDSKYNKEFVEFYNLYKQKEGI
ncbi:phosphoribosyltransferase [Peribacillus muralis]|uniref:phosphoribosyltransferase n=1 Tax=Peribacillus muralis TaxID=264697 RepID=UPI003670D893